MTLVIVVDISTLQYNNSSNSTYTLVRYSIHYYCTYNSLSTPDIKPFTE